MLLSGQGADPLKVPVPAVEGNYVPGSCRTWLPSLSTEGPARKAIFSVMATANGDVPHPTSRGAWDSYPWR